MAEDGVWHPVSSSNVEAVRRVEGALEVMFQAKGRSPATVYRWEGAGHLLETMLGASSAGKFVHGVLRRTYGNGVRVA